jgi:hypothetical protein
LFQSARWKAYLQDLQDKAIKDDASGTKNIYHIFHSQMLWFTRDEANGHQKAAEAYLERCDTLMKDCTTMVDALEQTLARTPKPSEVLDWNSPWY